MVIGPVGQFPVAEIVGAIYSYRATEKVIKKTRTNRGDGDKKARGR